MLDDYLEFVAARARRNTALATAFDLKVFFTVVGKEPAAVTTADVLAFIEAQRAPRRGATVVRLEDGEAGLAARTIKRRLATSPGCSTTWWRAGTPGWPQPGAARSGDPRRRGRRGVRGVPLIRAPRTLPRVLAPAEATRSWPRCAPTGTGRWSRRCCWAGCAAARCWACGWPTCSPGERRVFVADGKGGHQRIVPVSARFFATVAAYLDTRAATTSATDRVFVVLKGPRRGQPLDRRRAGRDRRRRPEARRVWRTLTCHQLRHTCFTRLREAGMALEAIQAQAGHRSIESTRIYLHLANDWLAGEYPRAAEAIEAQATRRCA